jgi:hypothetical protein
MLPERRLPLPLPSSLRRRSRRASAAGIRAGGLCAPSVENDSDFPSLRLNSATLQSCRAAARTANLDLNNEQLSGPATLRLAATITHDQIE